MALSPMEGWAELTAKIYTFEEETSSLTFSNPYPELTAAVGSCSGQVK